MATASIKLNGYLAEADRQRDLQNWDALPPLAKKIGRVTNAERGTAFETFFAGEIALRRAVAAWEEAMPVDFGSFEFDSTASARLPGRDPLPTAHVENALKLLQLSTHEDAKLLVAVLHVHCGSVADASLALLASQPETVPSLNHVVPLEVLVARSVVLEKTGALDDAVRVLESIRDYASKNHVQMVAGSTTLRMVETALLNLARLHFEKQNVSGTLAALQQLLGLPCVSDYTKRLCAMNNLAHLLMETPEFATTRKSPRKPEENEDFRGQTAALLEAIYWLKTSNVRDLASSEVIGRAFFSALEAVNVTAALPHLVKACEVGVRIFPYHDGLLFTYTRALIHHRKYHEALEALRPCLSNSNNEQLTWMATWLCLIPLNMEPNVVIEYARKGLEQCSKFKAHFHHALGLAHERQAALVYDIEEKHLLHKEALIAFKEALAADSSNWEIEYHLALHYAHMRKIKLAISHVKAAIVLNDNNPELWNLLVLLCSSNRDFVAAEQFCLQGLERFKGDVGLFLTWALIQGYLHGLQREVVALKSLFNRVNITKRASEMSLSRVASQADVTPEADSKNSPKQRLSNTIGRAFTRRMRASVVSPAGVGNALAVPPPGVPNGTAAPAENGSENATTGADYISIDSNHVAGISVVSADVAEQRAIKEAVSEPLVWVYAARSYLRMGNLDDALLCIRTACGQDPTLLEAWCLHGELAELQAAKDTDEILAYYQKALALDPIYVPALVGSGRILYKAGRHALAHHFLSCAVNLDEHDAAAWLALGRVYRALGDKTTAGDCLLRAFNEGRHTPLRPFSRTWTLSTGTEAWKL